MKLRVIFRMIQKNMANFFFSEPHADPYITVSPTGNRKIAFAYNFTIEHLD